MNDDRTNEALLERRALAEKVIPGPWETYAYVKVMANGRCEVASAEGFGGKHEAAYIAANSPEVVMADIDEIIRLRAENTWLGRETIYLATLLTLITDPEIGLDSQQPEVTRELVDLIKEKHSRTTVYTWLKAARKGVEEIEFMEDDNDSAWTPRTV